MEYKKPTVVISKCLGFDACYYSGQIFNNSFINKLKKFVNFYPVCPEIEIGLGVPRQTIRIVEDQNYNKVQLIQPRTGKNLTEEMIDFSISFINNFDNVDGYIFKDKSPSCGIYDIKVYSSINNQVIHHKGEGFFSKIAINSFPVIAYETEGRLNNLKIREHFLTKLFTFTKFKKIKNEKKINSLIKFHSDNKYLFLSYNQKILKEMGKLVANHEKTEINEILNKYTIKLIELFKSPPESKSIINTLLHIFGYFKKNLSSAEKEFFLNVIKKYRENKIPFSVPVFLLKAWIIEYNISYLKDQSFINPFPEELIDLSDSGKRKKL